MNYGFRKYYARSGLNPNKRDKPNQAEEKEPELLRKIRKYSNDANESDKPKNTENQ